MASTSLCVKLDRELAERVEEVARLLGVTKSDLVRRALVELLERLRERGALGYGSVRYVRLES